MWWSLLDGLVLRYPWLPAWVLAGCLLSAICSTTGCATHIVYARAYDSDGRMIAQLTNADVRLLSRGSTTLSAGPGAMLSVPALPPLQRPDKIDESVASQFEHLVAKMEAEGRLRATLPKPTTTAAGTIAYANSDLEMSEDMGKLARTGIIAAMSVWIASFGL